MDIQEEIGLYKKYRDSKLNNFGLQLSDFKNLDEYLGCLTWLNAKAKVVPEEFILVPIKLSEDAICNLARKRFEEGQKCHINKFGQFNESNKERWIQNQIGIIKNLHIDFLRTFKSL